MNEKEESDNIKRYLHEIKTALELLEKELKENEK